MIRVAMIASSATAIAMAAFLMLTGSVQAARNASLSLSEPAGDRLVQWSPVIRGIQKLLIEFELLSGPADGQVSPDTRHAIRAYQRLNGLPEDGQANAKLQEHMERIGRPGSLKQRLAKARREQISRARDALLQNPETRDLLSKRPLTPPAKIKHDSSGCMRAPNPKCLLEEAQLATRAVTHDDYRDWALRDVIRAQARAADLSEVRASIRRLSDIRLILVSLREAVIGLVAAGQLDEARVLAATIPDRWNRARALAAVVAAEDSAPHTSPGFLTLLALLPRLEDTAAAEIAAGLAAKLAARGAVKAASQILKIALSMPANDKSTDTYRITLGIIAGAHARIGQTETALRLLTKIGEFGRDHVALAEAAGQFAKRRLSRDALSIADRIRTPQLHVLALTKIASAQFGFGDHEAGNQTLTRATTASVDIDRPFAADTAMAHIATVWAEAGNYQQAFDAINNIKSRMLRARTIWNIAARETGDATTLGAKALRATDAIKSPFDRATVLTRAAMSMARKQRLGDARRIFAMALREARAVRTNWWRARIFSRLAAALLAFPL